MCFDIKQIVFMMIINFIVENEQGVRSICFTAIDPAFLSTPVYEQWFK